MRLALLQLYDLPCIIETIFKRSLHLIVKISSFKIHGSRDIDLGFTIWTTCICRQYARSYRDIVEDKYWANGLTPKIIRMLSFCEFMITAITVYPYLRSSSCWPACYQPLRTDKGLDYILCGPTFNFLKQLTHSIFFVISCFLIFLTIIDTI